jgi:Uma2 family endonuclease
MSQTENRVRWTTADLELFPENGNRYEIIDGELLVTRAPNWKHQKVVSNLSGALNVWSSETGLGEAVPGPGLVFTDSDNVIPDVVWASREKLETSLDEAGHLTVAPELAVEILSPGSENERRDRQLKLRLYSIQGVQEYWIVDRQQQQIQVYRRDHAVLVLVATLLIGDQLTSPLLPGFSCPVAQVFQ